MPPEAKIIVDAHIITAIQTLTLALVILLVMKLYDYIKRKADR